MNKYISISLFVTLFSLLTACQSKGDVKSTPQQSDTTAVQSTKAPSPQEAPNFSTAIKGKIETEREIPVYSRISEQNVKLDIENIVQEIKKTQEI